MPTPISAMEMPEGDYAIVEMLGHRTLIGRITEVERFGSKMCQIEPLFGDVMLDPVFIGGGSLYQFQPCTAATAYARRPSATYMLPPSIAATIPATALPGSGELPLMPWEDDIEEDAD